MLYLASKSPRRAELLQQIGVQFETLRIQLDESILPGESARSYVCRLAAAKARSGASQLTPSDVVLGADTVVVRRDTILLKPKGREQAQDMLRSLSGQQHKVMSAVAMIAGQRHAESLSVSEVQFAELSAAEIDAYLALDEYRDKAGAYAIQGVAASFIKHLSGSYSGVMGLPLCEVSQLLRQFGVAFSVRPDAH